MRQLRDALVNGTKHALAVFALHLDADGVAKLHEVGAGLAIQNGFDGAFFCDAAVTLGPVFLALGFHGFVADRAFVAGAAFGHADPPCDLGMADLPCVDL